MKHIVFRHLSLLIVLVSFPLLTAAQDSVAKWQRWEKTIVASRNYVGQLGPTQGNPYRDLVLRIRFTDENNQSRTFVQDAFWTGNTSGNTVFKVRAKLPVGEWKWKFESCTVATGQICSNDNNLTAAQGTIDVDPPTSPVNDLYKCGELRQRRLPVPSATPDYTDLEQTETGCLKFTWFGDTAWTAPPREINTWNAQQGAEWNRYLDNRKATGFTVILVAPAPQWTPASGDDWPPTPEAVGFSFDQNCSSSLPIPNNCSRPRPFYWDRFDMMVQRANARGLIVAIVGMIDPVVKGSNDGDPPFPNSANAQDFARYLAARLAGNHVVFSPGFDTLITSTTQNGTSIKDVMNHVGSAIKTATPQVLVANHLAGKSSCDDYGEFQQSGWLTFHLFQSGHAKNSNNSQLPQCPGRGNQESRPRAALRRVRQMPLTLRNFSNPKMPVINGEAPYDNHPHFDETDRRYRVRQSGYMSLFSGSRGYTYGAGRIWQWYQVGDPIYNLNSAKDIRRLFSRFRLSNLVPRHDLIMNQVPDPNHENKMTLATQGPRFLVAYLPGATTNSIRINTTGFVNLKCLNSGWLFRWINPVNDVVHGGGTCTQNTATSITLNRACVGTNGDCDWLLEISKPISISLPAGLQAMQLEAWVDFSPEDGTSNIHGQLPGGEPFVISPAEGDVQRSPHVARLQSANVVVWRSTNLEGSDSAVFGRLVDFGGNPLGERIKISEKPVSTDSDPIVVSDSSGNAVVVWSSAASNVTGTAVVAQRLDRSGSLVGEEIVVSQDVLAQNGSPLVAIDEAGGFVVVWAFRSEDSSDSGISFMRFDAGGRPVGSETLIKSAAGEQLLPAAIEIHQGQIKLSLMRESLEGEISLVEQTFAGG